MAASGLLTDFKSLTEQAIQASDQFSQLYYKTYDTQRHRLVQLYTDASVVVWNGNSFNGPTQINKFYIDLPATEHQVMSIDSQPINKVATQNITSILVVCEGKVKYEQEKEWRYYSQNFLLMSEDNKWKIISDCFRFIDFDG